MPTIARVQRVMPRGPITEAPEGGHPVWALIVWHDPHRQPDKVPGIAIAWTRDAVQVVWESRAFGRQVTWLRAGYVWREGQPEPQPEPWWTLEPRAPRERIPDSGQGSPPS